MFCQVGRPRIFLLQEDRVEIDGEEDISCAQRSEKYWILLPEGQHAKPQDYICAGLLPRQTSLDLRIDASLCIFV